MCVHNVTICKLLASDVGEKLVLLFHPFLNLLHNSFVLVICASRFSAGFSLIVPRGFQRVFLTPLCILSWLGTRIALFSLLRFYRNPSSAMAALVSITLLSWLHYAFLVASRPTDCFPRYSVHLGYDLLSEMVLELMPCATHSCLMVRLRCRFFQTVAALSLVTSSVALLLMLVVGFRCVFCFDFCFLFPRSLTLDRRCFSMSSLRPSSLTGSSPCILPAGAYWVLVEGGGFEPPAHPLFRLFLPCVLRFARKIIKLPPYISTPQSHQSGTSAVSYSLHTIVHWCVSRHSRQ